MTPPDGRIRAVLAAEPDPAPDGTPGRLVDLLESDLPREPVTVRVRYSSLNYKDGLAVTGRGRVVRTFPMVAGVDLAGIVEASDHPSYAPGDQVIATGFGLGEEHWGGFCELARVRPEWLVRIPAGKDARWAMAVGTAGLTSMLCVLALERAGLSVEAAEAWPIVVTGAAGGVGSVAVALLAQRGYHVTAVSGRPEQAGYLEQLGATEVIPRADLADAPPRPLDKERWAGGVDAVGGTTLATVLRQTRYGGVVAACGLTGGADLPTTVHPFILRGVTLAGVESVRAPLELRRGVGAARDGPPAGPPRRDDRRRAAVERHRARGADRGRSDSRAGGHRRAGLSTRGDAGLPLPPGPGHGGRPAAGDRRTATGRPPGRDRLRPVGRRQPRRLPGRHATGADRAGDRGGPARRHVDRGDQRGLLRRHADPRGRPHGGRALA